MDSARYETDDVCIISGILTRKLTHWSRAYNINCKRAHKDTNFFERIEEQALTIDQRMVKKLGCL